MAPSTVKVVLAIACPLSLIADARQLRKSRAPRHDGGPVRKPATDSRDYAYATFDSGLRTLVVNDPHAEKSAFAMAVEVGSLENPPDFQGLAHFCEHMLFLGSEKYPEEDAFSKHISMYGGDDNAYTMAEKTVYFADVGNDGLDKALDIWSQFFISPAFKEEHADKEVNAVNSEHQENIPSTDWRVQQLFHSDANPKNPMSQFATGDLATLKTIPEKRGKSVVDALRKFHSEHYCPEKMHLVLLGNSSTSDLMDLAHKHFDALPHLPAGTCKKRPAYGEDNPGFNHHLGNIGMHYTVPTEGESALWLMFPMPSLKDRYPEIAESYIWNALDHFGEGGLKAKLLEEDLSQSYSYYLDSSAAGSFMYVIFSLTETGLKHTEDILKYFFAYFQAIRAAGVDKELLWGMRQIRQMEFDYSEDEPSAIDFVSDLAGSLPTCGAKDSLTCGVLIDKPDARLIHEVLHALKPSNMNMAVVDPRFNEHDAEHRQPYYHFGYDRQPISTQTLQRLAKSSGYDLREPPALKYVPTSLDIIQDGASEDGPQVLLQQGRVEAWWLGMGDVKLPKAVITMKLGFPEGTVESSNDHVLLSILTRLVRRLLEAPSDALQQCGLEYSLEGSSDGIGISFSGFDQHIGELLKLVLPLLRSPDASEDDFAAAKRQLMLDYADVTAFQPYEHALEALDVATLRGKYPRADLLRSAQDESRVSLAALRIFLHKLFDSARVSILFAGNIGKTRARGMASDVASALKIDEKHGEAARDVQQRVLDPSKELEIRVANPIDGDPNSATVVVYQLGVPSIADRVHASILGDFMSVPVYDTLRTQYQLGYAVFGYVSDHASILEIRVIVQGDSEGPDAVEALIESTVQNITSLIETMSQHELEARKDNLRTALEKPDATMGEFASRHWSQIWDQTYCFARRRLMLDYLESSALSTSSPLLETWRRAVEPSAQRKKVIVKLVGDDDGHDGDDDNQVDEPLHVMASVHCNRTIVNLDSGRGRSHHIGQHAYWPTDYACEGSTDE